MPQTRSLPALDRLLSWSLDNELPKPMRYVVTTGVIVLIGVFRALFITSNLPWLLFVPAILLVALIVGRGPGVYAGILATFVAALTIGDRGEPAWLTETQWIGSVVFLAIGIGVAVLAAELRAAFARARRLTIDKEDALTRLGEREAFLSGVLASSTDCIKILDLDARLTFMSDGGQRVMEVSDFNAIAGCPWPDFWQGQGNIEAQAAVAAARAGESRSFVGRASTMAGRPRWWHVAVSPIMDRSGEPTSILSVSRDITSMREAEAESRRLTRIVENSTDFIGLTRLDGTVFFVNDAGLRLVGLDRTALGKVALGDFFPREDAEPVLGGILSAVDRDGSWSGERLFRHFQTGEPIPVQFNLFPVVDGDDELIGYGTVMRDDRDRQKAREQQRLLNDELSHRLKNVLAVVQSVASQTLRQADSLDAANAALASRLAALAQATNVLTAQSWTAADLADVVERTLAPHGLRDRFHVRGPAIMLNPQVTLAFALALHELATNACKYGSLSNETGHVELIWAVADGSTDGERRFHLEWREIGGPEVRQPSRQGFGSRMIERSLQAYFRGSARMDYRPTGLHFMLDAALDDAGKADG